MFPKWDCGPRRVLDSGWGRCRRAACSCASAVPGAAAMPVNVKAIKREHPSPLLSLSDRVKNVGRAQEYKKRCFSRLSTKLTHLCMPLNVQTSPVNSSIRTTLNTYTFLRIAGLLTETSRSPPPLSLWFFVFGLNLRPRFSLRT